MGPREKHTFVPMRPREDLDVALDGQHPVRVRAWNNSTVALASGGTHFVCVIDGEATLRTPGGKFPLQAGMFASVVEGTVTGSGTGLVVTRADFVGLFQLGGPIEPTGRLRYIDGCTDSLLIAPALRGDPCLNHLHIPANTRQTRHTHPSIRVGVIVRGVGRCVTAEREFPLTAGLCFVILPDASHAFWTDDESLDVVVYHPDSDTGPTHEDHPMINRTVIAER